MAVYNFSLFQSALSEDTKADGVDFQGKSLKLDKEEDAKDIVEAIKKCTPLDYLVLTGNTLGVEAAQAIAKALETHPEFRVAIWSDMFTGRMKTEIPKALSALGNGMITAGARLTTLELSDNAFGPIGVEGLAKLLQSDVCSQLTELRLNNNGLGITGGKLLSNALSGPSAPKLKVFVAGRNRLENEGAVALAQVFKNMGSLQEIVMPQNGIYHVGITALSKAFEQNPDLSILNLNDNTIGRKGAAALSSAFSKLKKLKKLNFGDCLLKSKGAQILAQGFLAQGTKTLESIDLSNNEIGRVACMQVVNCLISIPSRDTLSRVVLVGNSFGGDALKNEMKTKLGDCGFLSDGESDEEYLSGSEEESSDEQDSDNETENDNSVNNNDTSKSFVDLNQSEDNSGLEEIETDVGRFIKFPTLVNFQKLGANAENQFDEHLKVITEPSDQIQAYVEAMLKVSSLSNNVTALSTAQKMCELIISRAAEKHAAQWILANHMLVGYGLLKSENTRYHIQWDLPQCYKVLSTQINCEYFPNSLKETLRFFIKNKKDKLMTTHKVPLDDYPMLC